MEEPASDEEPVDVQATLGLAAKDMKRQPRQANMDDLAVRQMAATLSGLYSWVLPSDMLDIGGDHDTGLEREVGMPSRRIK